MKTARVPSELHMNTHSNLYMAAPPQRHCTIARPPSNPKQHRWAKSLSFEQVCLFASVCVCLLLWCVVCVGGSVCVWVFCVFVCVVCVLGGGGGWGVLLFCSQLLG